jgi:hypothetical protein
VVVPSPGITGEIVTPYGISDWNSIVRLKNRLEGAGMREIMQNKDFFILEIGAGNGGHRQPLQLQGRFFVAALCERRKEVIF